MTWLSMLFTDKSLVVPCIIQDENGNDVVKPIDYETYLRGDFKTDTARFYRGIAKLGHKLYADHREFDYCFSGHPTKKPEFEYMFGFGSYDPIVAKRHSNYGEIVSGNAIQQEFLIYQIKERGTQMYMMPCMYVDHMLTDVDFDNAVDFHLSDYCFKLG